MDLIPITRLPEEIWQVELDSGRVIPPVGQTLDEILPLPQPEGKNLRQFLKQV